MRDAFATLLASREAAARRDERLKTLREALAITGRHFTPEAIGCAIENRIRTLESEEVKP